MTGLRRLAKLPTATRGVVEAPVASLRPWPENPRWIAEARLGDLMRAMAADPEMLSARPLIVLPDGTVICGNQRLAAARELGWRTIPAIVADLGPERARLWALRDNNQYGEWREHELAELLAELDGDGIDLALSGFSSAELDRLLSDMEVEVDPDDAPPLPLGEPVSRLGEVYELGSHRLLCGDARDAEMLAQLMQGERAELLMTDPPYGVDYVGRTARELTIPNDDADGLASLLKAAFANVDSALARSARFYIAAPAAQQGTEFRLAIREVGWHLHQCLVWVKSSPVLGHSDHHFQHEDILYGWKPGEGRPGRGRHKGSRWYGDNRQSTAFFCNRPARSAEHPTMKPVALLGSQLQNSSRRGDIVIDAFAGSGSTLIACEQFDRRCFAVELDPHYCDVIRARYRNFTHDR
jgi:DNA modification methylase